MVAIRFAIDCIWYRHRLDRSRKATALGEGAWDEIFAAPPMVRDAIGSMPADAVDLMLDPVSVDVTSKWSVGGLRILADASATALRETATRQSTSPGLANSIGPMPARLAHGGLSMVGGNLNDARDPIAAHGPTLRAGSRPRVPGLGVRVAQVRPNPPLDRNAASSRNALKKEL